MKDMVSRRQFIINTIGAIGGVSLINSGCMRSNKKGSSSTTSPSTLKLLEGGIKIKDVNLKLEREPLLAPFGFKGGYLSELWQAISYIESTSGNHSIGLGTQSVLWSDSTVFSTNSESGGNAFMYAITERALQLLKNKIF